MSEQLKYSLTSDLNTFIGYVQMRQSMSAFLLAIKMIGFIEQDRAYLWPNNSTITTVTEHEQIVIRSLKRIMRMMRRYDAENDQVELLRCLMIECTRLLLLFNGDGQSNHPVMAVGLCFQSNPETRPQFPLAVKFGISHFSFALPLHSAGSGEGQNISIADFDQIAYESIDVRRTGNAGYSWFDWETYAISTQMADILGMIAINDL